MLIKYRDILPSIDDKAFVESSAKVIGKVKVGKMNSIWYNVVIRGDVNNITIGEYTNIQDGSILHVSHVDRFDDPKKGELIIGDYVTVGHGAILHGCKISNYSLIGMGAIVLDDAKIGEYSVVAAGSVVKEGMIIPPFSLVAGNPAKIKKSYPQTEETKKLLYLSAKSYFDLIEDYK